MAARHRHRPEAQRARSLNRESYASAVKREQELQAELDRITGRYRDQQRRSIEYAILQREVDTNRQLYDGLLQRYKEIGAAGVGTNNIAVVDTAAPSSVCRWMTQLTSGLPARTALWMVKAAGFIG